MIRIDVTSVLVDDQDRALDFYRRQTRSTGLGWEELVASWQEAEEAGFDVLCFDHPSAEPSARSSAVASSAWPPVKNLIGIPAG